MTSKSKYDSVREAKPDEVRFGPNNLRRTPPLYPRRKDRFKQQQQGSGSSGTQQYQQKMQQQEGSQSQPPRHEIEIGDLIGGFA